MITGNLFFLYAANFMLGLMAGFFMHRSDYCVAGMFRDIFLFRRATMLRFLFFQIIVTMVFFELARRAGLLSLYPFPLLGPPTLTALAGGFLFGIGMVLAGGCVVGTLYRIGAGNVLSMVALVGILAGSALYAEMHPWWSRLAKNAILTRDAITLPQLLGLSPTILIGLITVPAILLFLHWRRRNLWRRSSVAVGYIQPGQTALVLAGISLLSYLLNGMPIGVTTTYAKIAAMIEHIIAPDHVSHTAYFSVRSLDIIHPDSGAHLAGSGGPYLDTIWAIQFPVIAGIVLGSLLSALHLRELTLRTRLPSRQYAMVLAGGLLLGLASRMASGCNIWHLMGGLPILALQSFLFLAGLLPGCWLGSAILARALSQRPLSSMSAP